MPLQHGMVKHGMLPLPSAAADAIHVIGAAVTSVRMGVA
jgi:hypothetical protein